MVNLKLNIDMAIFQVFRNCWKSKFKIKLKLLLNIYDEQILIYAKNKSEFVKKIL